MRRRSAARSSSSRPGNRGLPVPPCHVLEEPARLLVVVRHRHARHVERVLHRAHQLDHGPVAPQRALRTAVEAHPVRDDGQEVVALRVGQVAGADLGAEVPAVERRRRVGDAADRQRHVADRGHRVPPQPELGEPRELGVHERHLQHGVARQLVHLGDGTVGGDQERQHVEAAGWFGRLPAEGERVLGELHLPAVAADAARRRAVPGVAHQLVVEDAGAGPVGPVGREHGDRGPDPAAAGGRAQVCGALVGDGGRAPHGPPVAHVQPGPVQPADAARRVAPRHPGAELDLGAGVHVGAGALDLGPHAPQPPPQRVRRAGLGVELFEEGVRDVDVDTLLPAEGSSASVTARDLRHPSGARIFLPGYPS